MGASVSTPYVSTTLDIQELVSMHNTCELVILKTESLLCREITILNSLLEKEEILGEKSGKYLKNEIEKQKQIVLKVSEQQQVASNQLFRIQLKLGNHPDFGILV
jgi:hypothetical protein